MNKLSVVVEPPPLEKYDTMCAAIEAAHAVDEVKDIRDKALALAAYARQAHNFDMEVWLCEIRLRAEKKAGALLKVIEKAKGAAGPGRGKAGAKAGAAFTDAPTLADHGVTPKQSSRWQKLADVPEPAFEAAISTSKTVKRASDLPSAKSIVEAAAPPPVQKPVSNDAIWLWGALQEFKRRKVFGRSPSEFLPTMTDPMRTDVLKLAPMVARWLGGLSDGTATE